MGHPHVRSDQYCLAVSYIELRTGELPLFGATNILKIAELHRDGKLDLSGLGPGEAEVIRRATHPDPHERRATCREMVRELCAAVELDLAGKPPRRPAEPFDAANTRRGGGSQTTMAKREPVARTSRLVFTAMLVLIIGGLTAAAVWWDRWRKPAEKDDSPPLIRDMRSKSRQTLQNRLDAEPATLAKSTMPDNSTKPPVVKPTEKPVVPDHPTKPPVVSHTENSVFADSRLWQERLKKGL